MPAWSGLWDELGPANGHTLLVDRAAVNRRLARNLHRRSASVVAAALDTVDTSTSLGAITHTQVVGTAAPGTGPTQGGVVTVETVTDRGAGTLTAAEVAEIDDIANLDTSPTYPTDAAGVGGGGKTVNSLS